MNAGNINSRIGPAPFSSWQDPGTGPLIRIEISLLWNTCLWKAKSFAKPS